MGSDGIVFVLWTALIGMGIVFLFLGIISLLMRLIRGIDAMRFAGPLPGASANVSARVVPEPPTPAPAWAIAAAAIYLEEERGSSRSSAVAWERRHHR